ncbi:MAG: FAD-dependent monooxygenase [Burkholderiales bacterium]|nr:FAD-dependent monooxygenase [Burkholderiales bacterium]
MRSFDVQVAGAGIVGKTLALALARLGLSVALRGAPTRGAGRDDVRAYALNAGSVDLLRSLKVWDALPEDAKTPVHDMLVHGDSGGEALEFSAWEQHIGELAVITDAAALEQELDAALRFAPHVTRVESDVTATLLAHCEGRAAAGLKQLAAGIATEAYGQKAIAARLVASRPHGQVARQWFRSPDVLALLPFARPEPGRSYGLVWSLPTERAEALLAVEAAEFERELALATGGEAGELRLASDRAAWPLAIGRAATWCGPGWVLAGDAAHVVHPLAGQGLNLGLADVAALVAVIAEREPWRRLGDERLLRRYVRLRAAPTSAMLRITDGLLRLFAEDKAPIRELRNNGLALVNRLSPLKRWLTARALDS